MFAVNLENALIPTSAAINSNLCKRGGGSVSPKIRDDGSIEYWCLGGQFDGQPVMNEID